MGAATATATNRGDNDAGCNEDPSVCASTAAATAASLLPAVAAMPQQLAGPPLLGVVAYFSSSSDDKEIHKLLNKLSQILLCTRNWTMTACLTRKFFWAGGGTVVGARPGLGQYLSNDQRRDVNAFQRSPS